jgi:hypothetical protein
MVLLPKCEPIVAMFIDDAQSAAKICRAHAAGYWFWRAVSA